MKLIRSNRPLIVALEKMSPRATRAARQVRKALEESDRLDKELIAACRDLAENDPDALHAIDVEPNT